MWIHPIPSKFSLGLNQLCSHHIHCNWWDQPPEILFLFLTCKWTHVAKKWLFSALLHPTPRPRLLENKIRVTLSLCQSMWSLAGASRPNEWGNEGPNKVSEASICHLRITVLLHCTAKRLERRTWPCQSTASSGNLSTVEIIDTRKIHFELWTAVPKWFPGKHK